MKRTLLLLLLLIPMTVFAHGATESGIRVRVAGFDPATNAYNISCEIPPNVPGSQVDPMRHYGIDPIPQGMQENYFTTDSTFAWRLDPANFTERVHTQALYHMYCEAQNYSAPPGEQNLASEMHVDLRTTDNEDVPDIYVLDSYENNVTLKCDPPDGVTRYYMNWAYRNRDGSTSLPQLQNQRIVNITIPTASAGWDVVCTVFDRDTGTSSTWDMPLELHHQSPAYVPTIEGCIPWEPCYQVSQSGIVPNGSLHVSADPGATVFLNEKPKGVTDSDGQLTVQHVVPGVYNIVLRKQGYDELSTLVPIAAGRTQTRTYALQQPQNTSGPTCHSTVFSLPVQCSGGIVTEDSGTSCRKVVCVGSGNSLQVLACDKPDGNADHFEMYKQAQTGSGVRICLGTTCLQNEGFVASPKYPICLGGGNVPPSNSTNSTNATNTTAPPNTTNSTTQPPNGSASPNTTNSTNTTQPNATNSTAPGACYSTSKTMPSSCDGGSLTQDYNASNGCRVTVCQNGPNLIQALTCDKAGFFEMYRQTASGSPPRLCIGTTCIQANGYAKSPAFPICLGNAAAPNVTNSTDTTQPPNTTNTTSPNTTNATNTTQPPGAVGLTLSIARWYPKGRDHVFVCNATGFSPTGYDWFFGDGAKQLNTASDNVFHRYASAGTYAVTCTARHPSTPKTANLSVSVT